MAEMWHYTSEGQPMDPVSGTELRKLATSGYLKPTDLVWKEGMPKWIRASSAKGLFSEPAGAVTSRPAARVEEAQSARSATREEEADEDAAIPVVPLEDEPKRRRDRDDYEDEPEDDYDRPRRRPQQGLSSGAMVGIIVGAAVLLVALIGGLAIYFMSNGGSPDSGTRSFSLGTNKKDTYNIRFTGGKKVEIWVNSTGKSDVDLFVFDANNRQVVHDDGPSENCYVTFVPQATQTYRVEVWNRHVIDQPWRSGHNSGTMRYQESNVGLAQAPPQGNLPVQQPPVQIPPIQQPPFQQPPIQQPPFQQPLFQQPPIFKPPIFKPPLLKKLPGIPVVTFSGQLLNTDPLDRGRLGSRCKIHSVNLQMGVSYTIDMRSQQFDSFLRLEDDAGMQLGQDDDGGGGLNVRIRFTPNRTGTYRIIATSFIGNVTGRYRIDVRR